MTHGDTRSEDRGTLLREVLEARMGRQMPEGCTYVMVPSLLSEAIVDFLHTPEADAHRV